MTHTNFCGAEGLPCGIVTPLECFVLQGGDAKFIFCFSKKCFAIYGGITYGVNGYSTYERSMKFDSPC